MLNTATLSSVTTTGLSPQTSTGPFTIGLGLPAPSEAITVYAGQTIQLAASVTDGFGVASVEFFVNDVLFAGDTMPPFELPFIVPAGVDRLTFRAVARNAAGDARPIGVMDVRVAGDPRTTIVGRVLDARGAAVPGALVVVELSGLRAEFFHFEQPLDTLPDLRTRAPDRTWFVSAANIRNPNRLFGNDPFGTGLSPHYAARLTGWLRVDEGGSHLFTLAAGEGARLTLNGATVVEVTTNSGRFEERSATVSLERGLAPIEILYYHSAGSGELQLSYVAPGGERQVVPPGVLRAGGDVFAAIAGNGGEFVIPNVPSIVEGLRVRATTETMGLRLKGISQEITPARGSRTDAGLIGVKE